ncbi:MAG: hypothetical protein Q9183_005336 [Haloplaca sp. 2 TL-2023]
MNVEPLTPDHSHAPPTYRRSVTLPYRLIESPRTSPSSYDASRQSAETLYAHNAGKIVSFNPPLTGTRRHSSVDQGHSALQHEPVGTLPWASITERTIAAGSLSIHKVLEVAFLSSGNRFAKPILSKSQCWCVDGESKFVLPVGPNTYYRIELPSTTEEDRVKIEEFKGTLCKILQYETTPCPFKRGFTVDLPERPDTPVRKKPWKPRAPLQPMTTAEATPRRVREPQAWERPLGSVETGTPVDVDRGIEADENLQEAASDSTSEEHEESPEDRQGRDTPDELDVTPKDPTINDQGFDPFKTPTRPRTLRTGRATTAPPQLSLSTSPPSDTADASDETASFSSSVGSFHSFHSPISPLPPSPRLPPLSPLPEPDDERGIAIPKVRTHTRDDSELTVTAERGCFPAQSEHVPQHRARDSSSPEPPQTPPLINDSTSQSEEPTPEPMTPSLTQLRRRQQKSIRRSQSPLPSPANLYSPKARLSGHHLTTAILQKTCSMLLGPPVSLVALMLNIAARILNGTYTGYPFAPAESSHKIPCSWDFSDTDQATEDEDDYGCDLGRLPSSRSSSRSKAMGRSWEVD